MAPPFAGKYMVERVLGQGGMGVVFAARHLRLGQRVAIKVLGSGLREHPDLVERFEREARAAGALTSAHAVRIFDIDATDDGTPYIVMELLAGRDLSTVIDVEGPQPVARASRWLIEACDAIGEAHRLGIIHRDLKPSNLFLSQEGGRSIVKVLDFGIAKSLATGEAAITQALAPLGTPHYMSPEQVRCAKNVDARTDVWSLGITFYELVCGSPPFAHESSSACIAAIAADPVPDPRTLRADLSAEVVAVMMKALAKNAADRYQSVADLVAALAPFAEVDEATPVVSVQAPSRSSIPIVLDLAVAARARPSAPSTVSMTSSSRGQRVRAALAGVTAAALGFAVLVVTPKCVSTGNDATASSPVRTTLTTTEPAPWLTAAPAAAPAPEQPAVLADPPPPAVVSTPLVVARQVTASPVSVKGPNRAVRPLERERAASASVALRAGAHGGLSGPGF